jgi:hypothetical protein
MKKFILVFSLLISLAASTFAQIFTIGTGTATTLYGPVYIYSNTSTNTHSWNLSIYTQSELVASGASSGSINSLAWFKNDAGYLPNDAIFEILIKPTSLGDFSGGAGNFSIESVGATQVYYNSSAGLTIDTGWVNFTLSTPYTWNGTDNLMILTRWVRVSAGTGSLFWKGTSGISPAKVSHSFSSTSTMGSLYTNTNRANLRFSISPLGLTETGTIDAFQMYPNPAKENFTLLFEKLPLNCKIQLLDALGQVVYADIITRVKSQIDLMNLANGVYFMHLETPTARVTKMLTVSH